MPNHAHADKIQPDSSPPQHAKPAAPLNQMLYLQRTIGNQALQRMISQTNSPAIQRDGEDDDIAGGYGRLREEAEPSDDDAEEVDQYAAYEQQSKGVIKGAKHGATSFTSRIKNFFGFGKKRTSSHPEMRSLTAAVGPDVRVEGEHGSGRKLAGGIAKLAIGNFIEAAAAGKKAYNVGKDKERLSEEGLGETMEEYDDLMSMVNSIKGALKRQAYWEASVGTIKQGLSLAIGALTGAPGAGELIGAGIEEVGVKVASSGASFAAGQAVESPHDKFVTGGSRKLGADEWGEMLTKYLNHSDARVREWVEDLIKDIFLQDFKGDQLLEIAEAAPYEAGKLIFARTLGAKQYKDALKVYRKAHGR